MTTPVYLEVGKQKIFACAVEWPGWERWAKTDEGALERLAEYAARYGLIAGRARLSTRFEVVERIPGTSTTDFGAPDAVCSADRGELPPAWVGVLERAWAAFDEGVARSTTTLQKGPRGGGRDRDEIVDHVREAERSYARSIGLRVPPRTPWPEQRAAIVEALRAGPTGARWPSRYHVRRTTWHVLDHLWEIEDKQT